MMRVMTPRLTRSERRQTATPVVCANCKRAGGTLRAIDMPDGKVYKHDACMIRVARSRKARRR